MLETLPYSLQESNFVVSLTVKKLNAVPISNGSNRKKLVSYKAIAEIREDFEVLGYFGVKKSRQNLKTRIYTEN